MLADIVGVAAQGGEVFPLLERAQKVNDLLMQKTESQQRASTAMEIQNQKLMKRLEESE